MFRRWKANVYKMNPTSERTKLEKPARTTGRRWRHESTESELVQEGVVTKKKKKRGFSTASHAHIVIVKGKTAGGAV